MTAIATTSSRAKQPSPTLIAGVNILVLLACVLQLTALVVEGTENVSADSLRVVHLVDRGQRVLFCKLLTHHSLRVLEGVEAALVALRRVVANQGRGAWARVLHSERAVSGVPSAARLSVWPTTTLHHKAGMAGTPGQMPPGWLLSFSLASFLHQTRLAALCHARHLAPSHAPAVLGAGCAAQRGAAPRRRRQRLAPAGEA
eukprot:scaffold8382_cov70-Phaeocystis_antarctica.AAC.8